MWEAIRGSVMCEWILDTLPASRFGPDGNTIYLICPDCSPAKVEVVGRSTRSRSGRDRAIRDSVKNAVQLTHEKGFKSIAFPLIGAGSGRFNREKAKTLLLDERSKLDVPITVKVVVLQAAEK